MEKGSRPLAAIIRPLQETPLTTQEQTENVDDDLRLKPKTTAFDRHRHPLLYATIPEGSLTQAVPVFPRAWREGLLVRPGEQFPPTAIPSSPHPAAV